MIGALLGGVGLFLLGMAFLTDGLQRAAGDRLREFLFKTTRTPLAGLVTGAGLTALVQSSSAITLATIGFVGAGLLEMSNAVGVIYGANLGTTASSWIVATLGLKLSMSKITLPLVGIGALGRMLLKGRNAALAEALAGFGLIFVGIDTLQAGMAGLTEHLDPGRLGGTGFGASVLLVLIGIVMTVVMQSSSAAVVTTLAAVDSGALGLQQAAAVVIGQNIGTTVTALLGTIGGSIPARRLAGAHVAFNVGTGLVAFLLLPTFVATLVAWIGADEPAIALASFHTAFNVLGVAIFLPLTPRLVALLERVIPERSVALTRRLSRAGADIPHVAVESARLTTHDVAAEALEAAAALVEGEVEPEGIGARSEAIRGALNAIRAHLRPIRSDPGTPLVWREHVAVLHAVDHLHRLIEALEEPENVRRAAAARPDLDPERTLDDLLRAAAAWARAPATATPPELQATAEHLAARRRDVRREALDRTAAGWLAPDDAESYLEAARWLDRVAYHAWRILHHLVEASEPQRPSAEPPAPPEPQHDADSE